MFKPCPIRVLIADDDPMATLRLWNQLSVSGYLVVAEAADGQEVVSLAMQLFPDVVVMDIDMPGMDGLEAGSYIDQEGLCPIILLGECSRIERVQEACALSAVQACLVKPVNERDLEPAIELAVARFRQVQRLEREAMRLRNVLDTRPAVAPTPRSPVADRSRLSEEAPEWIHVEARARRSSLERFA